MKTSMLWRQRMALLIAALVFCSLLFDVSSAPANDSRGRSAQRQTIVADNITSFFVRDVEHRRITLSVLVAHNFELTQFVRQLTGEPVTPLVFSVSTLPDRRGFFDPLLLSFEQKGRTWKPSAASVEDLMPLTADTPFGGEVSDGEVHQGVVFVPDWFNPEEPITVHYGDFRYQTRFINK